MCFLRLESFFSGNLQMFWKELCVQRQQLLETLSGNPEDQNYFHNNTEMEQDPTTFSHTVLNLPFICGKTLVKD